EVQVEQGAIHVEQYGVDLFPVEHSVNPAVGKGGFAVRLVRASLLNLRILQEPPWINAPCSKLSLTSPAMPATRYSKSINAMTTA
ncbi:MAG: hypothetical protein KDI08_00895, partial [Pseudomonadales bacterium]|nr:hypothetical protein [Pseudomonadales bacterium]